MSKKWIKGDCHLHTTNSDGVKTPEELYEALSEKGLDFAFITDHNRNTVGEKETAYKGVGIFPGIEISGDQGHVNVFCEDSGLTAIERPRTPEDYNAIIDPLRGKGAHVSVNHPLDRRIPWRMGFEDFAADSVEVWNSPMHTDDVYCLERWHEMLLDGKYIPAIGGSDYHRDYLFTRLLASPTTYVCAESNKMADVLAGIRAGHVFVTNSPSAARIFLTCGQSIPGDTVTFREGLQVRVVCDFLRRGQTLRVFNNDDEVLTYTADKRDDSVRFDIPVKATGFVRAQVDYELGSAAGALYRFGAGLMKQHDTGEKVPDFIYSFTNPIFFK